MRSKLKLGITIVALTAADAILVRMASTPVASRHGGAVTGRDWGCPACYK